MFKTKTIAIVTFNSLIIVLCLLFMSSILLSQPTSSTISSKAFGSKSWRENGLAPLSLPLTNNLLWDVRLASDGVIYYWGGDLLGWVAITGGEGTVGLQGEIGLQGPQGIQGEQGIQGIQGPIGLTGSTGPTGIAGADGQPRQLQDEGIDLTIRPKVNFIGSPVTCVDNAGQTRTDCTVTSGVGDVVGPASSTANAFSAFSGTTGKLLQNTGVLYKSTNGGGVQVGGSSGPVMNTLGAGIFSFRQSDEVSWSLINAEGYRAIGSSGTIKSQVKVDEISVASDVCYKITSGASAGGGDTTLCRASSGAWAIGIIKFGVYASPPITCGAAGSEGYEYVDSSHAKCYCNGTAWTNQTPLDGGSCS